MDRSPSPMVYPMNNTHPLTYVPGIGFAPSAPRSFRQHSESTSHKSSSVKRDHSDGGSTDITEATVKFEEGEIDGSTSPSGPSQTRLWSTDSSAGTQESVFKQEEGTSRPFEWNNRFQEHIARFAQSSRSQSDDSRRQDTSEGHLSREESLVAQQKSLKSSRSRSRSPGSRQSSHRVRSRSAQRTTQRDRSSNSTSSSIFFPDRQGSVRSGASRSNRSRSPSIKVDGEDLRCRCPISYTCPALPGTHLDCRPLVREWQSWQERQDQEAFELHRQAGSAGECFATDQDLLAITREIDTFKNDASAAICQNAINGMRTWILDMEDVTITNQQQPLVHEYVLPALNSFLDPNYADTRRAKHLPDYIEEEMTVLMWKWGRGDFEGSPERGLKIVATIDANGMTIRERRVVDPDWQFYQSALYYGAGDLVNGQVWNSRVELQRDGVHAPGIAGISGTIHKGARSVLLGELKERENIGYAEIDMGKVIEYVGTALPDEDPSLGPTNEKDPHMNIPGAWNQNEAIKKATIATQALYKSMQTRTPLRVIRSWKMHSRVTNKPIKGYRYDGLYRVTRAIAMKEARQIWSFRLERLPTELPQQGELRGFAYPSQQPDSRGYRKGHFRKRR